MHAFGHMRVAVWLAIGFLAASSGLADGGERSQAHATTPSTTAKDTPVVAPRAQPAPPTVQRRAASRQDVLLSYQRVGHALYQLQALRGYPSTFELWPRFRAIRLDTALATPAARLATLLELDDLSQTIERAQGIELSTHCLTNPLARMTTVDNQDHLRCEIDVRPEQATVVRLPSQ